MTAQTVFTLKSPDNKNTAFKISYFNDCAYFKHLQRHSYYSIILILQGNGKLETDFSSHLFGSNTMMCFSTYNPFKISGEGELKGFAMNFKPDFLCVYKHHNEIACNGVLFDNIYQPPVIKLEQKEVAEFKKLAEQIKTEIQHEELAQLELIISYLKIFLIIATRIKINQYPEVGTTLPKSGEPIVLKKLKEAIEHHYRTKHAPSDYADLLNMHSKSLTRITKRHFSKTLSDLITERIIIEAKRELYLTSKTVKQIAFDLGFEDEHYFSRFFKTNTDASPQGFRQAIGYAKAES